MHPLPEPIPGEFAGASLKRIAGRIAIDGTKRSDPRRIRRGLIEAASSWTRRCAFAVEPIPGEFAGASLKHCTGTHRRVPGPLPDPRRIRRGLIEAPRDGRCRRRCWCGPIPGEFAGASLKQGRNGVSRSGIPGEFAGASLKPAFLDEAPVSPDPRRIRRGLEADVVFAGFSCAKPIPGEFAGASLKPSGRANSPGRWGPFDGRSPANSPGPH